LHKTDLSLAQAAAADLTDGDLRETRMAQTDLTRAELKRASMLGARIGETNFAAARNIPAIVGQEK
jgi:uncharacterized protein YjbI with pentapeptide repeats